MRKTDYVPLGPQEAFIVPLLAREVTLALDEISCLLTNKGKSASFSALDCGCGNQPFRKALVGHGFSYESLDVTQNLLNNVDYVCALDAPSEVFSSKISKSYSLVMATEVLEHVSDWLAAFRNLSACTEPGGYLLLTAPFFYPLHEEPYDYCRPTLHQFEKLSGATGLEVISAKKLGSSVDVLGTTLGAAKIIYSHDDSILSKIINRLLMKLQRVLFDLIVRYRGRLDSKCQTIYLSNLMVLRKPLSC